MTKGLGDSSFLFHESFTFGMTRNESDLTKPRCRCFRCNSAWGFAKSRCIRLVEEGKEFCSHCESGCGSISDDEGADECPCRCLDPPWRFGEQSSGKAALISLIFLGSFGLCKVKSHSGSNDQTMRERDGGRNVVPSDGTGRPNSKRVPRGRDSGGRGDRDDPSDDEDLDQKLLKMKITDDRRRVEVWCTYHGWFPPEGKTQDDSDYDTEDQQYRRCRLPPHHLKHSGCHWCARHCGKFNADPVNKTPRKGLSRKKKEERKKKKDLGRKPKKGRDRDRDDDGDGDRSNWKFDPVTGRPLADAI